MSELNDVPSERQLQLLQELRPGTKFVVSGERAVMELIEVRHPVESVPVLACYELEGPRRAQTRGKRRAFSLTRLFGVVP